MLTVTLLPFCLLYFLTQQVRTLREKLQKLSKQQQQQLRQQQQIQSTNTSGRQVHNRVDDMKRRLELLTQRHAAFRDEMESRISDKNRVMQQLQKERRAIQTIMERKIKTLTDNIATACAAISSAASGGAASPSSRADHTNRLSREVQALQRLVNAAITALKNAETGSG